jgi:hypothetical protein
MTSIPSHSQQLITINTQLDNLFERLKEGIFKKEYLEDLLNTMHDINQKSELIIIRLERLLKQLVN